MNERYDQPFFVGRNNPRFRGVSIDGYLPALEISHQDKPQKETIHIHTHLHLDKKALRLQERIVSLEENLNKLIERKRTSSYTIK